MGVFERVLSLNVHWIGVCYQDKAKTMPVGQAMYCHSVKSNSNSVSVNIEDFLVAKRLRLDYLLLCLDHPKWTERVPMAMAIELMDAARQFNGTDYKLISKQSIDELNGITYKESDTDIEY